MLLRTELHLPPAARPFSHADAVLSVGSCFADRMAQRLHDGGFRVWSNPFGVIFHPLPMLHTLQAALENRPPHPASLVRRDGQWVSLETHSALMAPDPETLLHHWQRAAEITRTALQSAEVLMVTFGTAKGYWHPPTAAFAANCHKQPAATFDLRMSTAEEIAAPWIAFLNSLPRQPRVVLTVSPVRHTRDTLPVNSLSKAILRVACEQIARACPQVAYFPAYELLTDDLRDYRFYTDDLVHPSPMAERYIWEKFCGAMMSDETRDLIRQREGLLRDLAHRPQHPAGGTYKQFLAQLSAKISALKNKLYTTDLEDMVQERMNSLLKD